MCSYVALEFRQSKPYKNDPQILAMTNLVSAYQANDLREFERILRTNRKSIMDDPFVREYIQELLKNIRTEVLIKLIKPYVEFTTRLRGFDSVRSNLCCHSTKSRSYTRIRISFIAEELKVEEAEVEDLLVTGILDGYVCTRFLVS